MRILFIGPQGSGKGTQAQIISQKLNIPHISTGALFRSIKSELQHELGNYMNSGKLVPDKLTLNILKERISEPDCKNGFILDGFPRNTNQLNLLKKMTSIDKIIEINISDEEAVKRLLGRVTCENCKEPYNLITKPRPKKEGICDKCGNKLIKRSDDTEDAIKKRLEIYHTDTKPILKENKSVRIDGEQDIEKITQDILEALEE